MTTLLGRATSDLCVSVAASAIVALMVLAGGMALEAMPDDTVVGRAAPGTEEDRALTMCREDRFGYRCIPEES
jgi:hypothetical protein